MDNKKIKESNSLGVLSVVTTLFATVLYYGFWITETIGTSSYFNSGSSKAFK